MKIPMLLFFVHTCLFCFDRYELPIRKDLLYKSRVITLSQLGVTEANNNNDGILVNKYQKSAGIRQGTSKVKGDPYCMAGIYYTFVEATYCLKLNLLEIPFPKTGSSQVPFDFAKRNGIKTIRYPQIDDLFIWKQKNKYQGHVGRIVQLDKKGWVTTVEFNTSSGSNGSQRDGGGVYKRRRNYLHPLSSMFVRGFVGFKTKK